ncbi:hypothetical protein vseg_003371 [Gypsophila vaccaria]
MVFAFNGVQDRIPLWHGLRRLAQQISGPWAISGDFNCVLSATERVGGNVPSSEIEPFQACMEDCGVVDIPGIGSKFTWNNNQRPQNRIYSKPEAYAHFLPEGSYDHTPCIVSQSQKRKRKGCFKYFNMWGTSASFIPLIRSNWDTNIPGTHMYKLVRKMKLLKPALKGLNRDKFNEIERATDELEQKVSHWQEELGMNPSNQ